MLLIHQSCLDSPSKFHRFSLHLQSPEKTTRLFENWVINTFVLSTGCHDLQERLYSIKQKERRAEVPGWAVSFLRHTRYIVVIILNYSGLKGLLKLEYQQYSRLLKGEYSFGNYSQKINDHKNLLGKEHWRAVDNYKTLLKMTPFKVM